MPKYNLIILMFVCLFCSTNLLGQVVEEEAPPPPVFESSGEVSKPYKPLDVIPKSVWRGRERGKYGFYGHDVVVIPYIYDRLPGKFSDFMIAKKDKKYGVINKKNEDVIPFKYDRLSVLLEDYKTKKETNFVRAEIGRLKGLFNKQGEEIIPVKFETFEKWSENNYLVGPMDGKYGVLSTTGKELHSFIFEQKPASAWEGHRIVKIDEKVGVYDTKGNIVFPVKYDVLRKPTYSKTPVIIASLNGKFGLLDYSEKVLVPIEYEAVWDKSDNTWIVEKNNKVGVLNADLNEMVPIAYDEIKKRNDSYFKVRNNKLFGVVDLNGKVVLPCEYKSIKLTPSDIFMTYKEGTEGFYILNENAETVLPDLFSNVRRLKGTPCFFMQIGKGKLALYNAEIKKMVTDFEYDNLFIKRISGGKGKSEIHYTKGEVKGIISYMGEEQ